MQSALEHSGSAALRLAPLVGVDVVEHRLDVGAMFEAAFFLALREPFGDRVAPAAFAHEPVPNLNLLVARLAAVLKTPGQHIFVGAAEFHARDDVFVLDLQQRAAPAVEADAEVFLILRRQLAGGVQANFVEHPAEMHDAADLVVATAKSGNIHGRTVARRRAKTKTICAAINATSTPLQKKYGDRSEYCCPTQPASIGPSAIPIPSTAS